jgi:hypothetical protein
MKKFKKISVIFEQGPPDPSKFSTTPVKKPTRTQTQTQTKTDTQTNTKTDTTSAAPKPKPGELSAATKKTAAINSFGTIGLSDVYSNEYFAVKMNNLYTTSPTLYKKVKDQLTTKGYDFEERYNVGGVIDFYYKTVYLSKIRSLAPEGQKGQSYWAVIRELFKNYAPSGDKVGFNSIKTLQKPMTVTLIGGAQKSFGSGMEYFLTRLKQANSSGSFADDEAKCFLAFLCTLAPSALAEITAYAKADQNFSAVADPESIVLGEISGGAIINFYKIFVEGVRKKGGTWTIDEAWVVSAGFAKKNTTIDNFFNMINAASTGNYIDEALPKIKKYSAPSTGYVTPIM